MNTDTLFWEFATLAVLAGFLSVIVGGSFWLAYELVQEVRAIRARQHMTAEDWAKVGEDFRKAIYEPDAFEQARDTYRQTAKRTR